MLNDRKNIYKHTGSFVAEMVHYTDMYNQAWFKIQTLVEAEFSRKKKLLLLTI